MKEQGPILIIKHAKTRHDADAAILSGLHPTPVETIETPTRTYRMTDSEGKAPPLVPTVDAVKVWGDMWWRTASKARIVRVDPEATAFVRFGDEREGDVYDDGLWSGPVTERTKEKG